MSISIRLEATIERQLEAAAMAEGVSKSEFVRRCITRQLESTPADRARLAWELGKDVFGKHGSGQSNGSENDETILDEMFDGKRRNR